MRVLVLIGLMFNIAACSAVPVSQNKEQVKIEKAEYNKCGVFYKDKDGNEFKKVECKENWPANFPG